MEMDQTQTPDCTSWSNDDLVKRVAELEAQLRAQNGKHAKENPLQSSPAPFKKPKKPAKTFDPSKYNTRLIALKFAYLGSAYNGFEHHTNNVTPLPTVEEELYKALKKTRLIFPQHKPGQSEDEVCWEGCEYSKCGRTDRGVSAFGQVIGIKVRSARPMPKKRDVQNSDAMENGTSEDTGASVVSDSTMVDADVTEAQPTESVFDSVNDELPYIQLLNRVLPPDIRMLAWCPEPPPGFSARFNCRERRYRYFFTNPAYPPLPSDPYGAGEGWLNIPAMQEAAKKYEGLHDFRNFCKIDGSKQIQNFERRIFHAGIHAVGPKEEPASSISSSSGHQNGDVAFQSFTPKVYWFEVRGSAFLWHQVRHLVAVLFLVAQGYEKPDIVDELLDGKSNPAKPLYEMASDTPLVLWDCVFPDPNDVSNADHAEGGEPNYSGYVDGLDWVYVGDVYGGQDTSKRVMPGVEDGKHGRGGVMEDLWALWRKRKIDEVLAGSLVNVVAGQGKRLAYEAGASASEDRSARVFEGSELPRTVGPYTPVMQRSRMDPPEVVNARYAARKGLHTSNTAVDGDPDD